jgi:transposase
MTSKTTRSKPCPAELRGRAVRLVREAERDDGLVGVEQARLGALERENRELRQAAEILRKASVCFARAEPGSR